MEASAGVCAQRVKRGAGIARGASQGLVGASVWQLAAWLGCKLCCLIGVFFSRVSVI